MRCVGVLRNSVAISLAPPPLLCPKRMQRKQSAISRVLTHTLFLKPRPRACCLRSRTAEFVCVCVTRYLYPHTNTLPSRLYNAQEGQYFPLVVACVPWSRRHAADRCSVDCPLSQRVLWTPVEVGLLARLVRACPGDGASPKTGHAGARSENECVCGIIMMLECGVEWHSLERLLRTYVVIHTFVCLLFG